MSRCKHVNMAMIVYCGVDLGGGNRAMSQKMLDIPDVHALLQQEGGDRVPKHVGCQMEGQAGIDGVPAEHGANRLLGEAAAQAVVEEVGMGGCGFEPEGLVVQQGGQRVLIGELQKALSGSLAEDADAALGQIYVIKSKVADLCDSGSSGEEGLQDGDISNQGSVMRSCGSRVASLGLVDVLEEALEVQKGETSW